MSGAPLQSDLRFGAKTGARVRSKETRDMNSLLESSAARRSYPPPRINIATERATTASTPTKTTTQIAIGGSFRLVRFCR